MRLTLRVIQSALLASSMVLSATPAQEKPDFILVGFAALQDWAGPDSKGLGFTQDKLDAFLVARAKDLGVAGKDPWGPWLKTLATSRSVNLRAWALTRLVESGDYSAYEALSRMASEHIRGLSQVHSGLANAIVRSPMEDVDGLSIPPTFRMDPDSVFWRSVEKTVRESADREVDIPLYTLWCFGTAPNQKAIILEIASHVHSRLTVKNPKMDPWNDPRFWILSDWAVAWGCLDDFKAIEGALAESHAQKEFHQIFEDLQKVPGFFDRTPTPRPSERAGFLLRRQAFEAPRKSTAAVMDFDFSSVKVARQPPAPPYPLEARSRRLMNEMKVDMVIDPSGTPQACRPLPGPWLSFFAPMGTRYAMTWRFHPATLNGEPQYARFLLTLNFRLHD